MKSLGDGIVMDESNWNFKGDVVKNFEAHVSKSVPLYREGHKLIAELSNYFVKDDSTVYELGSSTGKLIHSIAMRHQKRGATFIGIDIEKDMVEFANQHYSDKNLSFLCDDIVTVDLEQSDMIISYYTIQFIHPKHRQNVVDKIYRSLNWGGAFVMYEKVRANDARFQDILSSLYLEYKLERGYEAEEIISKSRSLKGILEPFSTQANIDMLKRAGFEDIISIQKYINFEGFLAIK